MDAITSRTKRAGVAQGVLGHRMIIRPEAEVDGKHVRDVVRELLQEVTVLEAAKSPRG